MLDFFLGSLGSLATAVCVLIAASWKTLRWSGLTDELIYKILFLELDLLDDLGLDFSHITLDVNQKALTKFNQSY
jgi:hypothetical protein